MTKKDSKHPKVPKTITIFGKRLKVVEDRSKCFGCNSCYRWRIEGLQTINIHIQYHEVTQKFEVFDIHDVSHKPIYRYTRLMLSSSFIEVIKEFESMVYILFQKMGEDLGYNVEV